MNTATSKSAATIMSARDVNQFLAGTDLTENTWVLIGGMMIISTAATTKAMAITASVTSTNNLLALGEGFSEKAA
jgi:hypothetical protein